jgi:hypothetical protein
MIKIINATWRTFAISPSALNSYRLWRIGLAAACIAAALQPTVGVAQWSDYGRALIDSASDPRANSPYPHGGQPLRPGDVRNVLRDWGLTLLSGPTRSATSYQAIVRDDAGQDLFVAVDPNDGRILSLDLASSALEGNASFSRSDDDAGLGRESTGPSPRPAKAPASLSHRRPKAQVAKWIASPHLTPRAPVRKSERPVAVEPSAEFRAPRRLAARPPVYPVPRPSAGLTEPQSDTAPGKAATLTPSKASNALRTTSCCRAGAEVSTSAPPAPKTVSEAQKIEKRQTKPVIPADAGFD